MLSVTPQRERGVAAPAFPKPSSQSSAERYLSTAEAAHKIGMSKSWVEKGRVYGFGPPFLRFRRPGSKVGAVRYLPSALDRWMEGLHCNPEAGSNGQ